MLDTYIGNDWDELLKDEFAAAYFAELATYVDGEYASGTVYPPADRVFEALRMTPYRDVKAVILGQDPYHEPGQAHGLAFSVPVGTQYPPSLQNIFKELDSDKVLRAGEDVRVGESSRGGEDVRVGENSRSGESSRRGENVQVGENSRRGENVQVGEDSRGVLSHWASQGVLLLNTVLTVRAHEAGSHRGHGWEQFTDKVIELLARRDDPIVFILWGAPAGKKRDIIEAVCGATRHLIITAPHPSPLSAYRGFFGGRYFSRTNYFLEDNDRAPIKW